MAKHCTVCNQDYADELLACPHCASAKQTHLAGRAEDRTTRLAGRGGDRTTQLGDGSGMPMGDIPGPHDSHIDYGAPPPASGTGSEPVSGASEIAWASLVEEVDEGKGIKVDSPSDVDLLRHHGTEPLHAKHDSVGEHAAQEPGREVKPIGAEEEVVDFSQAPSQPGEPTSSSAVDLGGSHAELVEDVSSRSGNKWEEGESEVYVAELASDDSNVDLGDHSGINQAEPPVVEAAAQVLDSPADAESPAAELTEEVALDAVVADDESSAVDLGGTPIPSDASLSVEDVGAVEPPTEGSGIDLDGLPVPGASEVPSSSSDSSVDLGSHAEIVTTASSDPAAHEPGESGISVDRLDQTSAEETIASEANWNEEDALSEVEEPAVSEDEVNDLLAGLDQSSAHEPGVTAEESAEIAEGQEAIAAAEAEEAAESAATKRTDETLAEAEDEEKPAKRGKQPSRVPALVGGTLLGVVLGAGGLIGARGIGMDVPAMLGLGEKEKRPLQASAPPVQALQPKPPEPTIESFDSLLRNGEWGEAEKAGLEKFQAAKANELVARGEYRLGKYLTSVGSIKDTQDPALQSALVDLQKAAEMKDADAVYDLAFIKELAGQLPQARAEYAKGAQTFQNDAEKKQRFETAIERVDWKATLKAGGEAKLSLPQERQERMLLLALLLIGLQEQAGQPPQGGQPGQQPPAPPGQQPQAQASVPEAGFAFWQATRLAREGKYSDAVRALDQARKLHDQRRFTRLRKAQNPLSDPAEDIFLRSCDELKAYWSMEKRLHDDGYLTDKNTPAEALQAALEKGKASAGPLKDLKDKFVAAKIIGPEDDVAKAVDRFISVKKEADAKIVDLTKNLQAATEENTKLAGDLKAAKKSLEDRETALAAANEENKKAKAANGDMEGTLKTISDELASASLLDPQNKQNLGEAVKKALELAKMKDPQGMIRQQRSEIAQMAESLRQRRQPEEMLPLWLLLLDENRDRPELAVQASKDAERVKRNARATPIEKSEADVLLGLALRNAGQFEKAKPALETARGAVDEGEWLARANAAFEEVSNPAAYFGKQAQMLYDRGQLAAALAYLNRAMKVLPEKEQAKLLAQRSLLELDAALSKSKGGLAARDPLLNAARQDAEDAAKAGLAEGHYAAGRIAEALGQFDAAITSYRAALKIYGEKIDGEGSRYRMALARLLLLPREGRPAQKVGWIDSAPYPARYYANMKSLVLMLTLGLQTPVLPGEEGGPEEAEKLANDVLRAAAQRPGSVPFDVLAQALAVKGRWNEAWQVYLDGIRTMVPRRYVNGMDYLFVNDPRLQRPTSLRTANPLEAEKHFSAGLNFYFDGEYVNAEKEFVLTVENNSQDARYFYYLGLSRWAQNRRREAALDFDQGAKLESLDRPASAAVSESLERIQGSPRRTLNEYRHRPER